MVVLDKRKIEFCIYDDLNIGNVFVYEGGYYIKTDEECAALLLTTGELIGFKGCERVERTKATLIIDTTVEE